MRNIKLAFLKKGSRIVVLATLFILVVVYGETNNETNEVEVTLETAVEFPLLEDQEAYRLMREEAISQLKAKEVFQVIYPPLENEVDLVILNVDIPEPDKVFEELAINKNYVVVGKVPDYPLLNVEGQTPNYVEKVANRPCPDDGMNRWNRQIYEYMLDLNGLIESSIGIANSMLQSKSKEMVSLVNSIENYEAKRVDFEYFSCGPYYQRIVDSLIENDRLLNIAKPLSQRAFDDIFLRANKDKTILSEKLNEVKDQRHRFETERNGAGGLENLKVKHEAFLTQLKLATEYRLLNYEHVKRYNAEAYYNGIKSLQEEELKPAAISDLDRLRDEYVSRSIPVPAPNRFTQTRGSTKFTFSQLNKTNNFDWAVLESVMLTNLDAIATKMENVNYEVQLNSAYRNPSRSSGCSRHQYGYAIDLQVFDFNNSGGTRDSEDWKLLEDLIKENFAYDYIEPISISGAGHVHVDWGGKENRPNCDLIPGF